MASVSLNPTVGSTSRYASTPVIVVVRHTLLRWSAMSELFERGGCRITVVDFGEILAATEDRRVDLLDGALPGAPPWRVRLSISRGVRDHQPVYLLEGSLRRGDDGVFGRDPLGVLLERRLAAGDAWAARVVDGVGSAVSQLSRWWAQERPADDSTEVREDRATGLRATVA